jgi:hypothetical protein
MFADKTAEKMSSPDEVHRQNPQMEKPKVADTGPSSVEEERTSLSKMSDVAHVAYRLIARGVTAVSKMMQGWVEEENSDSSDDEEGSVASATVIEAYRWKMPTELKIKHYDAVILYHDKDRELAEDFLSKSLGGISLLCKEHPPRIELYDKINPEADKTPVGQLDETLNHCTYVLLFVTKNFVEDEWTEFSSQTALMDAIQSQGKRWSVVPIFTESKRTNFQGQFCRCLCIFAHEYTLHQVDLLACVCVCVCLCVCVCVRVSFFIIYCLGCNLCFFSDSTYHWLAKRHPVLGF